MGGSAEIDVETRVAKEREVRDREAGTYDAHRARESWLADSRLLAHYVVARAVRPA